MISQVLPASWQWCRVHFLVTAGCVPKTASHPVPKMTAGSSYQPGRPAPRLLGGRSPINSARVYRSCRPDGWPSLMAGRHLFESSRAARLKIIPPTAWSGWNKEGPKRAKCRLGHLPNEASIRRLIGANLDGERGMATHSVICPNFDHGGYASAGNSLRRLGDITSGFITPSAKLELPQNGHQSV